MAGGQSEGSPEHTVGDRRLVRWIEHHGSGAHFHRGLERVDPADLRTHGGTRHRRFCTDAAHDLTGGSRLTLRSNGVTLDIVFHPFHRHTDEVAAVLTDDCRDTPLWLDDVPPLVLPDVALPGVADATVVGSGYTGLNTALELARGGRQVLVLEAGEPGQGCSTRNGGQISTSVKPSLARLARRHGLERARAIHAEGAASLDWIETLVRREAIDCDFVRCGRFHAAHTPGHYERLAREAKRSTDETSGEVRVVPRTEQHRELGSDVYHGGVVYPHHASLHPARYHRALLARVEEAGATLVPRCTATSIARDGEGFRIGTSLGTVRTGDVVVATNGYTAGLTPWLQRRVVPIGSYVIATEPLPEALVDELFPTHRIVSDTCKVIYYYRPSPDRRRVVFGGRVSAGETDPRVSAPRLHEQMCRVFPGLADTRVSHSWFGTVAYSFDELAHTGTHEGVHYAMGYCGSGVAMASYLGMRLGQRLLGLAEGRTAFDGLPFPTRPLYTGTPWFLPSAVAWYRWRDRVETRRAAA